MKPICVKAYKDLTCFYIRNDAMSRHVRNFTKEYQMSALLNSTLLFTGICFVLNQGILPQRFCLLFSFHEHSLVRTSNGGPLSFAGNLAEIGFIITAWDCGSKGNVWRNARIRECENARMGE